MEIIKKAYNQESEESEEDEVSPREVGHNIYILAQQVTEELLRNTGILLFRLFLLFLPLILIDIVHLFISKNVCSWPDTIRSSRTC